MNYPNIVLIVIDTLRKDVLSIYGGPVRAGSLEWLGKEGVVFPNPVAPAPWSLPSHTSMFTGKYPRDHGVHETYDLKEYSLKQLMAKVPFKTLPEKLRELGYNTVGISANDWIAPGTGFERGFDVFLHVHAFDPVRPIFNEINRIIRKLRSLGILERGVQDPFIAAKELIKKSSFRELVRLVKLYIKAYGIVRALGYPEDKGGNEIIRLIENLSLREPFFLFINFMEVHQPYKTDAPKLTLAMYSPLIFPDLFGYKKIPSETMERIRRDYQNEVRIVDKYIWRIIGYLKTRNLYDNTLIIVVGDHGQELKERGYYGHAIYLHNEIIEVPFVVKLPRGRKFMPKDGYQSLTKIPDLIMNAIEGNYEDVVTRDLAFSEAYGITHDLKLVLGKYMGRPDFNEKRRVIDCERKAVYYRGYKLVINTTLNTIEEFSHNGRELNTDNNGDIVKELQELIESFRRGEVE
ncbi:sulfatase [Vulcanisaeta moutnovskia 768-28]|uniref:Sulfatase n=1 Tax=Vulcanisaeta moutnovskia (strain 768-28) TaxID=985053 RepID=F0QXV8_VULM7|nr:sulfatase [Vulcanisaeta moutnovskia]ADY01271.1 sulfatase [Vulcanisaeta moutnovskia 768-28]